MAYRDCAKSKPGRTRDRRRRCAFVETLHDNQSGGAEQTFSLNLFMPLCMYVVGLSLSAFLLSANGAGLGDAGARRRELPPVVAQRTTFRASIFIALGLPLELVAYLKRRARPAVNGRSAPSAKQNDRHAGKTHCNARPSRSSLGERRRLTGAT